MSQEGGRITNIEIVRLMENLKTLPLEIEKAELDMNTAKDKESQLSKLSKNFMSSLILEAIKKESCSVAKAEHIAQASEKWKIHLDGLQEIQRVVAVATAKYNRLTRQYEAARSMLSAEKELARMM